MILLDTNPVAAAAQRAAQGRLTGAQRLEAALSMSVAARQLALAGLKREHPDWSEAEVASALVHSLYPDLALAVPGR